MIPDNRIEFLEVQNSGWSDGTSWFTCGNRDPIRFKSKEEALAYISLRRTPNQETLWRIVWVTIDRYGDDSCGDEVIVREWKQV